MNNLPVLARYIMIHPVEIYSFEDRKDLISWLLVIFRKKIFKANVVNI